MSKLFQRQLLDATNAHLARVPRGSDRADRGGLEERRPPDRRPARFPALPAVPCTARCRRGRAGRPLTVSYTPSASVYLSLLGEARDNGGEIAGAGHSRPGGPADRGRGARGGQGTEGSEVYMGQAATARVLREKGAQEPVSSTSQRTGGSARTTRCSVPSASGMRHLNLFDLYQLNLPCELVTLSGCGTGLNMVVGGDELLGLVRGLLYAGSQAVLVTLWDVNDQSTAEFMELFYRGAQGRTKTRQKACSRRWREIRSALPAPLLLGSFRCGWEISLGYSPVLVPNQLRTTCNYSPKVNKFKDSVAGTKKK